MNGNGNKKQTDWKTAFIATLICGLVIFFGMCLISWQNDSGAKEAQIAKLEKEKFHAEHTEESARQYAQIEAYRNYTNPTDYRSLLILVLLVAAVGIVLHGLPFTNMGTRLTGIDEENYNEIAKRVIKNLEKKRKD